MVEHVTRNDGVVGSIPTSSSKSKGPDRNVRAFLYPIRLSCFGFTGASFGGSEAIRSLNLSNV